MKHSPLSHDRNSQKSFWKKASIALMTSTLLLGSYEMHRLAIAAPLLISQQQSWNADLKVARLIERNRQDGALVLQLNILNKPETSYANAVYQVFARRNNQWVQIFTSTGARLITSYAGQITLAPEVISLSDLRRQLGNEVDLNNVELRATAQLRYDIRGGRRDQSVFFEQTQRYRTIAQTTTSQLISTTTNTPATSSIGNNKGNFSLLISQRQATLSNVIARVSVRSRTVRGFASERFLGDFRYKINKKAKFIKGLNAGDRVVVRLFTPQNQFIGYSEFELLSENSAVTLVLPDRPTSTRIVRTIYGIDANEDGTIDSSRQVYDYFTQVTQVTNQSYRNARVTFFRSVQNLNLSTFTLSGLPAPRPTCAYPTSFTSGSFLLVDRSIEVFRAGLNSALIAVPGQLAQIVNISSTNISTYEVNQLLVTHQTINQGQVTVVDNDNDDDDDDDDDDKKGRKKRHCNQGIGNGSEGCDPGNSRPHGGSNDEGGRKPGKNKR
jgi:hypothetical protein